ncbi:MAG: cobyrinate a,c-diamide synthase [Pseudomonadota bacterium]|nr:cobyrinate a,c-diamide synthase [Pseudomonadota bacterium]
MSGVVGAVIAAPSSGSGKTTVTLGLLRYFARNNIPVSSFKIGPDYIDPGFHTAASGRHCLNIDSWAMRPQTLAGLFARASAYAEIIIGEGVMGLFDGAQSGEREGIGSTADVSELLGLPVILVVDARAQAQSAAATVHGFASFRSTTRIAGVIFNRTGGPRHASILEDAVRDLGIPVLGCVPTAEDIILPDRHLGLVQAREIGMLEAFLDRAADLVAAHIDLSALRDLLGLAKITTGGPPPLSVPPLGARIAVGSDDAFQFSYRHVIDGWRSADAEIFPFSPLADEPPDADADAVFLPGGYPELHAGKLSSNECFLKGLTLAHSRGATIYGECGGFMVLGTFLTDADGAVHRMAGLLPVETSFFQGKLHLGYREAVTKEHTKLGPKGTGYGAHEFHYASIVRQGDADALFAISDAADLKRGETGLRVGNTMGSFMHLIDRR